MKKLLFIALIFITFFCNAQNSKAIIGKPVKIGNLLVAKNDFPGYMDWDDAKAACAKLGKGWRLSTDKEFYLFNFIFCWKVNV